MAYGSKLNLSKPRDNLPRVRRCKAQQDSFHNFSAMSNGRSTHHTDKRTARRIEYWSRFAQDEAREFDWAGSDKIEAIEEALALFRDSEKSPTCMAWHDHTAVIIPLVGGAQQIVVEYTRDYATLIGSQDCVTATPLPTTNLKLSSIGAAISVPRVWLSMVGRRCGAEDMAFSPPFAERPVIWSLMCSAG